MSASRVPGTGPFTPAHPFVPQSARNVSALAFFLLPTAAGNLTAAATPGALATGHLSLFIPGFAGSKEDFLGFFPMLRALMPSGRGLVSYSQRGQADSAAPRGISRYRLEDFVSDGCEVLELLHAADRPVDLVGHSFGGVVARRIALARPTMVRSLTLFSSGATPIPRAHQLRDIVESVRSYGPSFVWNAAGDPAQSRALMRMMRRRARATSLENLLSIARILARYSDVTDGLGRLHRHGLPIMVVYGADDRTWPPGVYRQEAVRLGVTAHAVPGAGHNAQLDRPEALAELLISFWDGSRAVHRENRKLTLPPRR